MSTDQETYISRSRAKLRASVEAADRSSMGKLLRVLNVAVSCLLITAGIITILSFGGNVSKLVIGCYVVFFGLVLIIFETRIPRFQDSAAKNFGFLYSWSGRAFFMVFLASLALGLGTWGLAGGIVTYVAVFVNAYVLKINKGVADEVQDMYRPNASGEGISALDNPINYSTQTEAARAAAGFLADNPEYAHQAVQVGLDNPELVKQAFK